MPPEQVAGDPDVGPRADLYAWGCLAYEVLTGKPPFVRDSAQRMLAAHLSDAPAAIAPQRGDVPITLERLVLRCLAKDPNERPESADELLREL
jgi:serine/threonine protein kinase